MEKEAMLLSELIVHLQEILAEHGDMPCQTSGEFDRPLVQEALVIYPGTEARESNIKIGGHKITYSFPAIEKHLSIGA